MKSTRWHKLKVLSIYLAIGVIYYILYTKFGIGLVCPVHLFLHVYCPGCGITRMIVHLVHFEFYEAFRSNMYLFIFTPFIITANILCNKHHKVCNILLAVFLGIAILFGVLRNIFPVLASI